MQIVNLSLTDWGVIVALIVSVFGAINSTINTRILWRRLPGEQKKTSAEAQKEQAEADKTNSDTILSLLRKEIDNVKKIANCEGLLEQTELIIRKVMSLSNVAYWEADAKGNCVYSNTAWTQLSGLSYGESRGEGWFKCLTDDEEGRQTLSKWLTAVGATDDRDPIEFKMRNAVTQETFKAEARFFVIANTDGSVYKIIGRTVRLGE